MTDSPPILTDLTQLARARARATDEGMFLQREAALEVQDRLTEVNRRFTKPAVVTGFPEIWAEIFPEAVIVPDSEVLDLQPGAHDLVIHGLALHWANDPVGQLIQSHRALVPDGLFMGVMFGGNTLYELRATLAEAEVSLTGGLSPRVAPMGEIRDLGALLQRAGFALPVADGRVCNVSYLDALSLMRDLRAMGETNALAQRLRKPMTKTMLMDVMMRYESSFGNGERVHATFDFIFLTGWAPHESQQKPLRPGSAVQRLAEALGTTEGKLPD